MLTLFFGILLVISILVIIYMAQKKYENIDIYFSEKSKMATTKEEDKKIRTYMRIGLWMVMLSLVYTFFTCFNFIKIFN